MRYPVSLTFFASSVQSQISRLQEYTLSRGYLAKFNQDNCTFKLEKYTDCQQSTLIFASDDQLLQVGTGNVDDITVMENGNITDYPTVSTRSLKMTCSAPTITVSEFGWNGQIIVT
jgi:hypothetical protein